MSSQLGQGPRQLGQSERTLVLMHFFGAPIQKVHHNRACQEMQQCCNAARGCGTFAQAAFSFVLHLRGGLLFARQFVGMC